MANVFSFALSLIRPIVNLNGDSRQNLVDDYMNAMHAIDSATERYRNLTPHGRNFPGNDEKYRFAREAYFERLECLKALSKELETMALSIANEDADMFGKEHPTPQ